MNDGQLAAIESEHCRVARLGHPTVCTCGVEWPCATRATVMRIRFAEDGRERAWEALRAVESDTYQCGQWDDNEQRNCFDTLTVPHLWCAWCIATVALAAEVAG